LIEHWERIAYARKKYNLGSYTAYGTDDRGLIYIKYGKPTRIKSGFLGAGTAEIRMRVDDFLEATENSEETGSFNTSQFTTELWNKKQTILFQSKHSAEAPWLRGFLPGQYINLFIIAIFSF
jgi:GWxTD domain-containing protein